MVKCHEDAYLLNNLSLFAFHIKGHWAQINKCMEDNKPPVLSSVSLEYQKIFCLLQGVPKLVQILTFFLQCLKQLLGHPVMNKIVLNTPTIEIITLGACFPSYFSLFGPRDLQYGRQKVTNYLANMRPHDIWPYGGGHMDKKLLE